MSQRRKDLTDKLARFQRVYGRKKRKGMDPNDRGYDRELESKIRRMDPEELDELLRGDDDEVREARS